MIKKALVTGGAGFIGSHLVDRLIEEGFEVIVLDNLSNGRLENLSRHKNNTNLKFYNVDVSDFNSINEYFKGVSLVFHLAALADIVPSIQEPLKYYKSNVDGTVSVLEASRLAGVDRFVYTASSSCYGIPDHYPTPESAAIKPQYPYALTKYLGELCALHWGKIYGLPVVSLRLFNVYGPRSRTSGTYGAVFGVFLAQKLAGMPFTVVGDGTQTRDFTFVTDVVEAFISAAKSDVKQEIFNVGSGNHYSVNRLVELLGGEKAYIPKRPGEPDCTFADTSKIRKILGWAPKVTFEDGVRQMLENIDYWKNASVWDKKSIADATKEWFKYLGTNSEKNDIPNNQSNNSFNNIRHNINNFSNDMPSKKLFKKIFITGGAGYVGSMLVRRLLEQEYDVVVYDLYLYGEVFSDIKNTKYNANLTEIKWDIRDKEKLIESMRGCDAVIHLACISNDPSFELNPELGKSINYDAFFNILDAAKKNNIKRFIYASSSSVYGVKDELNVTEEFSLEPLTEYSKYKVECEKILREAYDLDEMEWVIIRPATVCGYTQRLRLDLTVNILTIHALVNKKIKIFGGKQLRPNINVMDMCRIYELLLTAPREKIDRQTFNGGYQNLQVEEIARIVKRELGYEKVELEFVPTNDNRSYHINSDKIKNRLGFIPKYSIEDAVKSLKKAYEEGKIIDGLNNPLYHNIKRMQEINLK